MTVGANLPRRPSIGSLFRLTSTSVRDTAAFRVLPGAAPSRWMMSGPAVSFQYGRRSALPGPVDGAVFSRSAQRDAAGASRRARRSRGESPSTRRGPLRPVA